MNSNDGFTEHPHKRHSNSHKNNHHNNYNNQPDYNNVVPVQYNNTQYNNTTSNNISSNESWYEPDQNLIQQAEQLRNQSRELSQQSQSSYNSGNGALAKQLSQQSKSMKLQAEQIEFRAHNINRPLSVIDLHMLYVDEAINELNKRIDECIQSNINQLTIIVGRGIHSTDHILKLGPAAENILNQRQIQYQRDTPHVGCLMATLSGTNQPVQQYNQQSYNNNNQYNNNQFNNNIVPSQQQQQYNQARAQQQPDPIVQCINILSKLSKCTIM